MPLSLEQYATVLAKRDLVWPAPPKVEPPKARPHLVRLPNLRAVTWNVYGTLLAITGGELYFKHPNDFIMEVALDKTVQEFNMWGSMSRKPGQPADYLKILYSKALDEVPVVAGPGPKYPETVSDRVWESVIKKLLQKDYKWDVGAYGALDEYAAKVAYFFHASLQGTACYDGAADALQTVRRHGLKQAVVADGQCFTLVQLQRGLKTQDASADVNHVLDADLNALSYKIGFKKPSERLFQHTLNALKAKGITPDQVLHVGSRLTQDVAPAKKLGMKTALFTGDAASLQATPDQLKAPASRPDLLLTELAQIADVLPAR
jgi:FMN phosphatase YigB (HAD superfamily)